MCRPWPEEKAPSRPDPFALPLRRAAALLPEKIPTRAGPAAGGTAAGLARDGGLDALVGCFLYQRGLPALSAFHTGLGTAAGILDAGGEPGRGLPPGPPSRTPRAAEHPEERLNAKTSTRICILL